MITRRRIVGTALAAPLAAAHAAGPEPLRGGTLTALLNPEPPRLLSAIDPSLQIGAITTKIMPGVLSYDLEMQPQPLLAERWEVAADGLSWSFYLRQGVRWHDGRDFTSTDVAFSLGVWKTRHTRGRQKLFPGDGGRHARCAYRDLPPVAAGTVFGDEVQKQRVAGHPAACVRGHRHLRQPGDDSADRHRPLPVQEMGARQPRDP